MKDPRHLSVVLTRGALASLGLVAVASPVASRVAFFLTSPDFYKGHSTIVSSGRRISTRPPDKFHALSAFSTSQQ